MAKRTPAAGRQDSHPFARETGDAAMTQQFVDQFINDTRTPALTPLFSPFGHCAEALRVRFQQAIDYGRTTHAEITSSSERGSNAGGHGAKRSGASRAYGVALAEMAAQDFAEAEAEVKDRTRARLRRTRKQGA
jgi:hypothetical protein